MEAIILGNPTDITQGGNTPIDIPAYEAEKAVVVLSDGYTPYILEGGGYSDSNWFRYTSGILRPYISSDKVVIGGTSLLGNEILRVVGEANVTSLQLGSSVTINAILDEDDMISNSNTAVPTQQSVKAYVDSQSGGYLQAGDNISLLVNNISYLTEETDPIFNVSAAKNITDSDISNWNTAYSWGNWNTQGFLTTETDPIFIASVAHGITGTNITNWNTAYTNNHTHTNKTILDTLTSVGAGTQFLANDGTYKSISTTVAGSDTEIQFNDGGTSFGGDSTYTFNKSTKLVTSYDNLISNNLYIGDTSTYINNASGDLSFTDINAGTVTLSTLLTGATNYWTAITGGIYYGAGLDKIGINTSLPNEALTVVGNIEATQFNTKYYRYNGNWLIGTNVGLSLLRTNCIAFDNIDTTTPLALMDLSTRQIEFDGDVILSNTKSLTVGNTTTTQYLQFGVSPTIPSVHTEGQAYWNSTLGVLNIPSNISGCVMQVGTETWVRVYNNTGSTIPAGTPVYVTSASGDLIIVAPARANSESTSLVTIGLTTNSILTGNEGFVTYVGIVHDINTSSLTEGCYVYVSESVAGGLTSTRPTAPNTVAAIGICTVRDASVGSVFVNLRVQPTVEKLSNVYTSGKSNDDVLAWDAVNNRWRNRTIPGATPPSDGILDWDTGANRYQPYATQQASVTFDSSSTNPTLTTRLNINANFHSTNLQSKSLVLLGSSSGNATIITPAIAGTPMLTLPTTTGTLALTTDIPSLVDDILDWSTNKYTPYAARTAGCFYSGTTAPSSTNRLNYDGNLYANLLATSSDIYLPSTGNVYLGSPTVDGSWRIAINGTGLEFQRRESGSWIMKQTIEA